MLLRLLLFALTVAGAVCRRPEVTIVNGTLLGSEATVDGRRIWQFLGIPFAEPPLASLRLRPPRPVHRRWPEPLVADTPPSGCLHAEVAFNVTGPPHLTPNRSEDCLYLNVWTPALDTSTRAGGAKRPVAVWLHGGGFVFGEGLPLYQGRALAALGDLVVVVVQYRLGLLGFARFDPELVPGNLGLLDQQAALLWVRENIGAFGGDSDAVTLFGESAGAASVAFQAMSADGGRYFRRAIMQSGSPLNFWACNPNAGAMQRFSHAAATKYLNCDQSGAEALLKCLQGKSEAEMTSAMSRLCVDNPEGPSFGPVVDGKFIKASSAELLAHGGAPKKDLLIGLVGDEGSTFVQFLTLYTMAAANDSAYSDHLFNTTFVKSAIAHLVKYYPHYPNQLSATARKALEVRSVSHVDPSRGDLNGKRLVQTIGEHFIVCGVNTFADAVAAVHNNVYFYEFTHRPSVPLFPLPRSEWMGAMHGDDIPFVFHAPLQYPHLAKSMTKEEKLLSRRVIADLASFAKTGRPRDPKWRPYTLKRKEFYRYGIASSLQEGGVKRNACAFWDLLMPTLNSCR